MLPQSAVDRGVACARAMKLALNSRMRNILNLLDVGGYIQLSSLFDFGLAVASIADKHLVGLLKRLVNQVIDAENLCQTLDGRITRLQASKSAEKSPQELQRQFDAITKEAEIKLIEATLENLKRQKQETSPGNCDKAHQSIADAIENWRSNFSSSF